ncbi:MAG: hypothetical protein P4L83_14420 [Nevskia sp.]|nr:hypothetical protein [Nevskia sp.]
MKVNIEIERSIVVPLPYQKLQPLLSNPEATIGRMPKLKRLVKLGENTYRLEMRTVGSRLANIAHDVSFGAKFHVNADHGELRWDPVPGQGNALISGYFRIARSSDDTDLRFRVWGELRDVPIPLLYRMVAPPFIQGKFTRMVDTFLEQTREDLIKGKAARHAKKHGG